MFLLNNITSWNETLNDTLSPSPQYPSMLNPQYRQRNAIIGALGILLNLLVLPVICTHDDLSLYLKATFCCMATGDLVAMGTTLWAGFMLVDMTFSDFASTMRKLTCAIYLAGNINCMVMVAIAVERTLALCRPELFRRLGKSKVKAVLIQMALLASGGLLTLPVLLGQQNCPHRYTPLATVTPLAVATEAGVTILSSLTVCVLYTFLAFILVRRTATLPPTVCSSENATTSTNTRCSGTSGSTGINNNNNNNNSLNVSDSPTDTPTSDSSTSTSTQHLTISLRQMRRFRRATVHSAVLAIWFFLAYTPFGFYYLWVLVSGTDRKEESNTVRIIIISSFPLANSLVDPVLLLWRLFPFSLVRDWIQVGWFHTTTHFMLVGHHLRQRLSSTLRTLRRSCRWRRNRVGDVGGNTYTSGSRRRGDEVKTVVVDGPSCSARAVHVREAPSRKKVRLKSSSNSSSSSSRRMSRISEQNEDTHM